MIVSSEVTNESTRLTRRSVSYIIGLAFATIFWIMCVGAPVVKRRRSIGIGLKPMILTDTPIEAFDKVSINTVGKLRTTPRGNCHLLAMQCNLTKYVIVIPLPTYVPPQSRTPWPNTLFVASEPREPYFLIEARVFLSEIVEGLLRIFRIHYLTTLGYHPQTNGSLERSHAPLVDFIRTYSEKYDDWDNLAPFASFTYNTIVHSATNFTPFELVFGKLARCPIQIPADEN